MKKIISIVLCLLMTASLLTGFAEPAAKDEAVGLPEIGDVVEGFEVLETRPYPLIGADIVLFEHQKTGAKLMYIANDDTERAFELTFLTQAIDNTGLPHVFEHSTLDGSEKYPSKALFFNLNYQTYNTYMNAYTQAHMTGYPIASLSEAQLLKLADFYTDSCLHPMVLEDESIYREEAWRYRLNSPEDELTYEGTVYSEMLGASTLPRQASLNILRAMYPGSFIGNEHGGEPASIPDMTWEMLKEYHEAYYHPSNCMAYLYGDFEDYTAFLALLDEAFSPYEKREMAQAEDPWQPLEASVTAQVPYAAEADTDTDHTSVIYYGFLCPGLDERQELILNTLTDLLSADSSCFQQAVREKLPSSSASCYVETRAPEFAVMFELNEADPADAEIFRQVVDDSLKTVAEEGFPQDMVDGVMASLSISEMLIREGTNVGVDAIIANLSYDYAASGDPWGYIAYTDALGLMDEWNQQGLYAEAVSEHLLSDPRTALVTTYPEPGLKEQNDEALRQKLAGIKSEMSDEEIAAIVEASNAGDEEDDASQYVRQLQAVTVSSLPEEIVEYDVRDETDANGVRTIDAVAGVEGIGQANVFLDASGLAQEDIHWFKLLTGLVGEMDTSSHTRSELSVLSSRYLYNGRTYISLPDMADGCRPYLRLSWISRDEDLAIGYDLMYEMLFDMDLTDASRVLEVVRSLKASLRSAINQQPYSAQLYTTLGAWYELYAYYSYVNFLPYYEFLGEAEQLLLDDPDAALAKLESVRASLHNASGAILMYAGNEQSIEENHALGRAFLEKLDNTPIERVTYTFPAPSPSEAMIVDSAVQYNGVAASFEALGLQDYDGALGAVTSLISDTFLYPLLRDQYGAYSVMHSAFSNGSGMYIVTYRDPNVAESYQVFEQLPELIASMQIDQETLDGYILSSYSGFALSEGALSGAVSAAQDVLEGEDPGIYLTWMRQLKALKAEDLENYADIYARLVSDGYRFTSGSAAQINANSELFETVLNPFNAQDPTQVEFTDVPQGHEYYEAVRLVFEQGLMLPLAEDAFGVDEEARNEDLFYAADVLIGGSGGAQEGLETLAEYGLADASLDLSEPLEAALAYEVLAALVGEESSGVQDQGTLTRGELAEALMVMLFSEED